MTGKPAICVRISQRPEPTDIRGAGCDSGFVYSPSGDSSSVLPLIEAFAQGTLHPYVQPATGRELIEKSLSERLDLALIGRNVNQIVAFMRIRQQIVEAVVVPDAMIKKTYLCRSVRRANRVGVAGKFHSQ